MSLRKNVTLMCSFFILVLQIPLFAVDSNVSMVSKPVVPSGKSRPQIEFKVSVVQNGNYYISFAMYGNFEDMYDVLIDGHKKGVLYINANGLQNVFLQKIVGGLDAKTFNLKKGIHTITVLGINEYIIPNVLDIKVGENYKETMFSISKPTVQISEINEDKEIKLNSISTTSYCSNCYSQDRGPILYDYEALRNVAFYGRTFSIDLNLSAGDNIKLETNSINGYYPTIYLFKKDNTGDYTWTSYNTGNLTQQIPVGGSGSYHCMLLANGIEAEYTFYSTLNGVPKDMYAGCQVRFGSRVIKYKSVSPGGCFFTNTKNGGYGDPVMYIRDQNNRIVAYNDDACWRNSYNPEESSYDPDLARVYGLNSRCYWSGATSAQYVTVLLFSYYNNGDGNADVYTFVKDGAKYSKKVVSCTQNNLNYNCHSWGLGFTNLGGYNFYPGSPYGGADNLETFDNWFSNKNETLFRYAGAPTYERCNKGKNPPYYEYDNNGVIGGYDENAVVDLWGGQNQSDFFTHTSVSKDANAQFHGIEWESKDGPGDRFFHPRADCGHSTWFILFSYKPKTYSSATISTLSSENISNTGIAEQTIAAFASTPKMRAMGINHPLSFEESVELGLTVMRNAAFTSEENEKIDESVSAISNDIHNEYTEKLSAWKQTWKDSSSSFKYNLKRLNKSNEHTVLKNFYKKNEKKLWPLVIKMVKEKQIDKEIILEDALADVPMGDAIMDKINRELSVNNYTDDGALIVTGSDDRCIMICQRMLQQL